MGPQTKLTTEAFSFFFLNGRLNFPAVGSIKIFLSYGALIQTNSFVRRVYRRKYVKIFGVNIFIQLLCAALYSRQGKKTREIPPPIKSSQQLEYQKKKITQKPLNTFPWSQNCIFYKLRQPQQIAVVILINQLASVDQAIQNFKGVALNSGLYHFRKLSSLFCIHRFTIIHYFYLFISARSPSE